MRQYATIVDGSSYQPGGSECVRIGACFTMDEPADILVATVLGNRLSQMLDVRSAVRHFENNCSTKEGRPPVIFSVMKPQSDDFFGAALEIFFQVLRGWGCK